MPKHRKIQSKKTGRSLVAEKPFSPLVFLKNYWEQKSPVLRFVLAFAACLALFYILYLSDFYLAYVEPPLIHAQAAIGKSMLNLLGENTSIRNTEIIGTGFSLNIKKGCDGLEPLAMLLSGILVFPIAFRWKWRGILFGTLALMILNQLRIAALYLVGKSVSPELFDWLHMQGGFVIFTALVVVIWIMWANWAMKASGNPAPSIAK